MWLIDRVIDRLICLLDGWMDEWMDLLIDLFVHSLSNCWYVRAYFSLFLVIATIVITLTFNDVRMNLKKEINLFTLPLS